MVDFPHLKKAFVIGSPIAQSKSPVIHRYWLEKAGLQGSYDPILVEPDGLEEFIAEVKNGSHVGGNITIPHKEVMTGLVDKLTERAAMIGAVNTLWHEGDLLVGDNTDAAGFSGNLDQCAPRWRDGKKALVIGAGGASRAVIFAILEAGYQTVLIANRTLERAETLADHFGDECRAMGLSAILDELHDADLIVNTTSLGMAGDGALALDFSLCKKDAIVTDIVYTPLETQFILAAKENRLMTVDGLGMLLHQAVPGFAKWFGVQPVVDDELRSIVLKAMGLSQ